MIFGLVIFCFCPVSQLTCIQSNIAPSFQETTICKCSYWSVSNPSQKSIPNLPMYQDLANVLFWGDHKSMFIKWYQLPNVVDQRLPPHMSWITNPPLVCYGERIHPWYAKDHESTPGMQWITNPQKKLTKTQGKLRFFLGRNILQDFGDPDFFRWNWKKQKMKTKSILWRPVVCWGERCYATENDSTPGMLGSTNPPLVCYGSRIHPWYATDHESTPGMLRITTVSNHKIPQPM